MKYSIGRMSLCLYTNLYTYCFFKVLFILKARVTGRREVMERERGSYIHWFTPQMAITASPGPGQSQDPGASSWVLKGIQWPLHFDNLLWLFSGH